MGAPADDTTPLQDRSLDSERPEQADRNDADAPQLSKLGEEGFLIVVVVVGEIDDPLHPAVPDMPQRQVALCVAPGARRPDRQDRCG